MSKRIFLNDRRRRIYNREASKVDFIEGEIYCCRRYKSGRVMIWLVP